MAFTVIRLATSLFIAVLATQAVPVAAQRLSTAEAHDFQMFRHSISVRRNARVCERNVPDYAEAFGDLYARWFDKHRAEIDRGESLFKKAQNAKDPKRYPYIDRVTLTRLEAGIAELAQSGPTNGPTAPAPQVGATCEKLLTFLKQN
jgi:hypothetical protein